MFRGWSEITIATEIKPSIQESVCRRCDFDNKIATGTKIVLEYDAVFIVTDGVVVVSRAALVPGQ